MPTPPLSDEILIQSVAAYREHGSQNAAARAIGVARETLQNRLKVAAARGFLLQDEGGSFEVKARTVTTDAEGQLLRQSVRVARAPAGKWEPPAGHAVKGYSTLLDGEGRTTAQWVKTQALGPDPVDIAEAVKAAFEGWEPRAAQSPAPVVGDEIATLFLLPDAHLGQLSWQDEAGASYDLKIAEATITDAFQRLVDASTPSKMAVVLGLGDLLHADGYENITAKSKNILDVDSRWPKVLQTATRLIISSVHAALAKHDRVLLRVLQGNHDNESAIAITLACSMFFTNEPRVTVDDDPSYFWFWEWGQTLIAGTHGDQTKMKDVPLMLASRKPEAWGRCRYKHAFTGHIHHASSIEVGGVIVESLQSPAASDAWHARQGFTSGRSLTAVTYHRSHGEIGRHKARIVN